MAMPSREMRIVIEIGPGADDPVDEAGLDERHQAGGTEAGRRQLPDNDRPTSVSSASILLANRRHRPLRVKAAAVI